MPVSRIRQSENSRAICLISCRNASIDAVAPSKVLRAVTGDAITNPIALVRLQNSVEQSEISVSEMKRAVDQTEQEVAVLRYRREHADVESQTLDLISSSTAKRETVGAVMNDGITRLKGNVNQLEARNETRRGRMSLDQRPSSNAVSRQWDRLESLKMIHDEALPDADRQSAETPDRPQD